MSDEVNYFCSISKLVTFVYSFTYYKIAFIYFKNWFIAWHPLQVCGCPKEAIYDPVCGVDTIAKQVKTFGNYCELNCTEGKFY